MRFTKQERKQMEQQKAKKYKALALAEAKEDLASAIDKILSLGAYPGTQKYELSDAIDNAKKAEGIINNQQVVDKILNKVCDTHLKDFYWESKKEGTERMDLIVDVRNHIDKSRLIGFKTLEEIPEDVLDSIIEDCEDSLEYNEEELLMYKYEMEIEDVIADMLVRF